MKRKQTAVEWLVDEFKEKLTGSDLPGWVLEIINQAKAMEKEQIVKSHEAGQHYANQFEVPHNIQAEQYYNETFKSE